MEAASADPTAPVTLAIVNERDPQPLKQRRPCLWKLINRACSSVIYVFVCYVS